MKKEVEKAISKVLNQKLYINDTIDDVLGTVSSLQLNPPLNLNAQMYTRYHVSLMGKKKLESREILD